MTWAVAIFGGFLVYVGFWVSGNGTPEWMFGVAAGTLMVIAAVIAHAIQKPREPVITISKTYGTDRQDGR